MSSVANKLCETTLIGCGILRKEISYLLEKNKWKIDSLFLDPALHCDLDKLALALQMALAERCDRNIIVVYGCCHPCMEDILKEIGAVRTEGQNCIEMLLGRELYQKEIQNGAFFLMEDWSRNWPSIIESSFGTKRIELIRDIFQTDRKYLVGIKTICSGDYQTEAETATRMVDLPLCWMDVSLDRFENVLYEAVQKRIGSLPCPL